MTAKNFITKGIFPLAAFGIITWLGQYRLLVLEDYFPEMKLERNTQTGDVLINFHNKTLNDFLFAWGVIRGKREKGLISEEEYLNWKYR